MPNSRPRCILNDTKSMPNRWPSFLNKWLVTSCVIESSIAWATWFISPIRYSSNTPARYKSYGRRIKSDKRFEAANWFSINLFSRSTSELYATLTNEFMRFGPAFDGRWQQRMAKTECSRCKWIDNAWINFRIVPEIHARDINPYNIQIICSDIYPSQYPSLLSTSPNFSITSLPNKIGKNSLNVMCWMMAMLIRRASWNRVSSSQCGLIWARFVANRLCSLAINVCMQVSTSCSFTRISPASKQYMLLFGRVQPSSGKSNFNGSKSFSPYSWNTGFMRNKPPMPERNLRENPSFTPYIVLPSMTPVSVLNGVRDPNLQPARGDGKARTKSIHFTLNKR